MKRILLLLLSLLCAPSAMAQLSQIQRAEGLTNNLLGPWNPGFELGKAYWTASGGTFSVVTASANVGSGLSSVSWTPTANTQTLVSKTVTVPAGMLGQSCQLSLLQKGGDTSYTLAAYDVTSSSALGSLTLAVQSGYVYDRITFNCPAAQDVIEVKLSTSSNSPAIIYLDNAFLGSLGAHVTQTSVDALTNKDYQGGTASNTSRFTTPSASQATLTALTRKQGTLLYDTDTNQLLSDDGTSMNPVVSTPQKNYLRAASSTSALWFQSAASSVTIADDATAVDQPRNTTTGTSFKVTTANNTNHDYVYTSFILDQADYGRKLLVQTDINPVSGSSYATNDLSIEVHSCTNPWTSAANTAVVCSSSGTDTTLPLSTDVTAVSGFPNLTGTFRTAFDAPGASAKYILIKIKQNTNSIAAHAMAFSDFVVGPGVVTQGAAVSAWQTFTPTGTWSTNTTYTGVYRRVGDTLQIAVKLALAGAPTSAGLSINMPTGYTINTASMLFNGGTSTDRVYADRVAVRSAGVGYEGMLVYDTSSLIDVYVLNTTNQNLIKGQVTQASPGTFASGDEILIDFQVPVNELAGSGTVNIVQNDCSYSSNSSSTDAADTGAFVYGPGGSAGVMGVTNLTANRRKRVRFPTAISTTDSLTFEISNSSGDAGAFFPLVTTNSANMSPLVTQNGVSYGVGIDYHNGVQNNTDIDVIFGTTYGNNTTYGGASTLNWSGLTSYVWRVKKCAGGQVAGFGTATPSAKGLVSSYAPTAQSSVLATSANYAMTTSDGYSEIDVTTGSSAITVTLPPPASNNGRVIVVKKVDSGSGTVVIAQNAAETIDGAASNTLHVQYSYQNMYTDGTNWFVSGAYDTIAFVPTTAGANTTGNAWATATDLADATLSPGVWEVRGSPTMGYFLGSNAGTIYAAIISVNCFLSATATSGTTYNFSVSLPAFDNSSNHVHTSCPMSHVLTITTATAWHMNGSISNFGTVGASKSAEYDLNDDGGQVLAFRIK